MLDDLLKEHLARIEYDFKTNPYKIWNFLNDKDLHGYILGTCIWDTDYFLIGVDYYDPISGFIYSNFLYHVNRDVFWSDKKFGKSFYRPENLYSPDCTHMKMLKDNDKYKKFLVHNS